MRAEDKPWFVRLLADVLAGYDKSLPEKTDVNTWLSHLAPFSPSVIEQAFENYRIERPDFAPLPNSVAARCKLLDGRPVENEAWAIAQAGRDEADTVVWTEEIAQAFEIARSLLNNKDEIGGRMAFKDAYKRLVNEARSINRPARWIVSSGWDIDRQQLAIERAVRTGLLSAPQAPLALTDESKESVGRPKGLQAVLNEITKLNKVIEKFRRMNSARLAQEESADTARRKELDEKVQAYLHKHPDARYGQLLVATDPTLQDKPTEK